MKNLGIVIHDRAGHTSVRPVCEEHLAVAVRAAFGEQVHDPLSSMQEPTGEVIESDDECLVCAWIELHQVDPLAPIVVRPKHKIRQNIVTE